MFLNLFKSFFLIFILYSCTTRQTSNLSSIEDFILDSYKINEGKVSILQMRGLDLEPLDPQLLEEKKDVIKEEDVLFIEVFHPTRVDLVDYIKKISSSIGFIVIDGKIKIPHLDFIHIKDLTLKEAQKKLQERYQQEIQDIEVFISFKTREKKQVEVAGLINKQIDIDVNTRLFDILIQTNLPTDANLFKSYILRDNKVLPVDFFSLVKKADMSQNIVMQDKDKIYIADKSSSKVYILGEVASQRAIEIPDGKISLKEALSLVGGALPSFDKSFIQIFRADIQKPKIYLLNWDYITKLPSSSLNLIEGDIVYVSASPISSWNRFVAQILPTISLMDIAYRGYKNMGIIINADR